MIIKPLVWKAGWMVSAFDAFTPLGSYQVHVLDALNTIASFEPWNICEDGFELRFDTEEEARACCERHWEGFARRVAEQFIDT